MAALAAALLACDGARNPSETPRTPEPSPPVAAAAPADAAPPPDAVPDSVPRPPMPELDDAVKLLSSPDTWCDGAARLARLGNPEAILPLVAAMRSGHEASTLCLVEAVEALGGAAHAASFAAAAEPERRHAALDVLLSLGTDAHLPIIEQLAADPLPSIRQHTLKVAHQLKRTPAWRQTMFRLLAAPDAAVRAATVDSLALDVRGDITTALRERLPLEPDPAVKAKIEAALAKAK